MTRTRLIWGAALTGLAASTAAAAAIWLLLTSPATVADAVNRGDLTPVVRALAGALYEALVALVRYL
jgi:hypothetical protein